MLELFFDCSSPWTWLAFHNVQPIARELGVEIHWRPVLLGGILGAVNPAVYAFRESGSPAKKAYIAKDLQDCARAAGLSLVYPPRVFPVNTVKAMRGCLLLAGEGLLPRFAEAVFRAYWQDDRDVSQDAVLSALCRDIGVAPERLHAGIRDDAVKRRLRDNTDEVIARGGFGSPTMFVDGSDMYFGNDRLGFVRDALLAAQARRALS